ncbi:hypothetical protein BGZ58_003814, partial [Dissophora ornata]
PIADSAKIHFNIGVVLSTLGDFAGASAAYSLATKLDQYLAIAYFQNGVANVALEDYAAALNCFHDAYLYLRGNVVIDYTQLNLDFKLFSCQVLFNRALCYIEVGEMDLAMTDLWRATREKQNQDHDIFDQALRDKGQNCTVFTLPEGVLYRPPESKVKNSKKKDYLGSSKVIAAIDASDSFSGFKGKSAWQVQMSGPINVAAVEEPRAMTPPIGLQRRATERVVGAGGGRARRGTDPERPMLEHSASFNSGLDGPARRGPGGMGGAGHGPSSLGPAGSEPRMSLLSRRNTDAQRPAPLNLNGNSNYGAGGPASAAPAIVAPVPRSQYQDELDDLEKHVYALSLESQGSRVGTGSPNLSSTDLRASPVPTRSNSNRPGILRKASQSSMGVSSPLSTVNGQAPPMPNNNNYNNYNKGNNGYNHNNYDSNPPSRTGTPPVLSELRRSGSNNSTKMGGLSREDSVRSVTSGGSGGSMGNINGGIYQQPNGNHSGYLNGAEGSYLDEPVYAGLRDK